MGRIAPPTWRAVEALLTATATSDTLTMAKALATIGATSEEVNLAAFAADLDGLLQSLQALDTQIVVQAGAGGAVSASLAADDAAVNRLLLELVRVGEANGIRFPREFGLLLKQVRGAEGAAAGDESGNGWVQRDGYWWWEVGPLLKQATGCFLHLGSSVLTTKLSS